MLTLTKITLTLTNPTALLNKHIKIQSNHSTATSKLPSTQLDEHQIEWNEPITLPVNVSKMYAFEIVGKHQFGYNPEEFMEVLSGEVWVGEKEGSVSGAVLDCQGKKVGIVKMEVKIRKGNGGLQTGKVAMKMSSKQQVSKQQKVSKEKQVGSNSIINLPATLPTKYPPTQYCIQIHSIVAHLPLVKGKICKLKLSINGSTTYTEAMRSRAGELVFIGLYKISVQTRSGLLIIQAIDDNGDILAKSQVNFQQCKLSRKGLIFDTLTIERGQLFLQSRWTHPLNPTSSSQVKLSMQSLPFHNNISHPNIHTPKSTYSSQSQSQSQSTTLSKKISLLHNNNDIKFAKEKRFTDYTDKKSSCVSYLKNTNFQFRNKGNDKFYRGASIGWGNKEYFTQVSKKSPGVGEYQLPSIWDRYLWEM